MGFLKTWRSKSLVSSSISTGVEIFGCWTTAALFLKFIVNYIAIIFKLYIYSYRHHLYNWSHVFNPIQSISKMVTPGFWLISRTTHYINY